MFLRCEIGVIMILGTPGSGENKRIHSITTMVDDILHGFFIRLGSTGTASFIQKLLTVFYMVMCFALEQL